MEAIYSSETSVYTISTRRHIPEDGILNSHRRENLESYREYTLLPKFESIPQQSCTVTVHYEACP
jgi:hypothetical protein